MPLASMESLTTLLARNHQWAEHTTKNYPLLFPATEKVQRPMMLWLGCSDSRVPAEVALQAQPGDIFVHRNIGNIVPDADPSSGSVVQYAVEVLKVRYIVICGHYCCGGINASLGPHLNGPVEDWLKPLREIARINASDLDHLEGEEKANRLVELNVLDQVEQIKRNRYVRAAKHPLQVHGWVYDVSTGLIKSLLPME